MEASVTLDQSRWLITGSASGIGAAVTQRARDAGAQVLALDIDDTGGGDAARACGAEFMRCDVADPESWQAVSSRLQTFGSLTHVHLNAGIQIAPPDAPLAEYRFDAMTLPRYRRMMGVNVDGVVFGLHTLLPHLQHGASVLVTASLAGITPYDVDPLYAMSKHAVVGLVRSLAPDFEARGFRINALCPGGIDTAIIPEAQRGAAGFMTPQHIAEEVITLLEQPISGKSWAKVSEAKPAFIVRAPGDKDRSG